MKSILHQKVVHAALALIVAAGCSGAVLPRASQSTTTSSVDAPAPARDPKLLRRVVVVGASVSEGFGNDTKLASVVDAVIERPHEPAEGYASSLFFSSPLTFGPDLLGEALDDDPTLLVAIDYLFWFGYGHLAADGTPIHYEEDRLELLERGLALLEPVRCRLVLGDAPDMSPAIGLMLVPEQVLKPETLTKLNERLRAWARDRTNVIVLPLSAFVTEVRAGRPPP